jgi:DNA repair protein RadC
MSAAGPWQRLAMRIGSAKEAAEIFGAKLQAARHERVAVAHLGAGGELLALTEEEGGQDSAPLPIRAILADALRLDAAALVLAHSHPSGDAEPSAADISATRRLAEAARALGIRLSDHLIFAGDGWSSLRMRGLL